jgi:hypothetical protein
MAYSKPKLKSSGDTSSPRFPLDRRLGGPQSRSGRGGEEYKILATAGNRTPVVQRVT